MIQFITEHYSSVVINSVIYKILTSHSIFTMLSTFFLLIFITFQHSLHKPVVLQPRNTIFFKCCRQFIATSLKLTLHANTAAEENDTQCSQFKNLEF